MSICLAQCVLYVEWSQGHTVLVSACSRTPSLRCISPYEEQGGLGVCQWREEDSSVGQTHLRSSNAAYWVSQTMVVGGCSLGTSMKDGSI